MTPQEESDEDYLDDPIRLIDFESQDARQVQEFGNPEKYDRSQNFSYCDADVLIGKRVPHFIKESITLPVTFFDIPRNIVLLDQCRSLSIKIVDCDKHPWYYKKHYKTPTDIIYVDDDSITDFIEDKNEKMNSKYQSVNNIDKNEQKKKPKIRPVATPYQNLNDNRNKKVIAENNIIGKEDWNVLLKKNPINLKTELPINYKKNEGLVGLRIRTSEEISVAKNGKDKKRDENNSTKKKSGKDYFNTRKSLLGSHLKSNCKISSNGENITFAVEVSKDVLDKTPKSKSSFHNEHVIKCMDKFKLNKTKSNYEQNDLKRFQGMKVLYNDSNLKTVTNNTLDVSKATNSTKPKKELVKSCCDKLYNNTKKQSYNVDIKGKKIDGKEITKGVAKKKDKKLDELEITSNVNDGIHMAKLKPQQDNVKKTKVKDKVMKCDKKISKVKNKVMKCDEMVLKQRLLNLDAANKETALHVQKNTIKNTAGQEGKDTLSKQSTKKTTSIVNQQLTAKKDEQSCSSNNSRHQLNQSIYYQILNPTSSKASTPDKSNVSTVGTTQSSPFSVEKNLTPTGSSSLAKSLTTNVSTIPNQNGDLQMSGPLVQQPTAPKEEHIYNYKNSSFRSSTLSSHQLDQSVYSQMPNTTWKHDKSNMPSVGTTQLSSFYVKKNPTPTSSSLGKSLSKNVSTIPKPYEKLQMYSPAGQVSSASQRTEKTHVDLVTNVPHKQSKNACINVSISAAPTSSHILYQQSVPRTPYKSMPASYNTSKHMVLVARDCSGRVQPHTNLGSDIFEPGNTMYNQYQNCQVGFQANQNSLSSCDLETNKVPGVQKYNVPLNDAHSEPYQIMNGHSNNVTPNVTISIKPNTSDDISGVANNLPLANAHLTNLPVTLNSDLISDVFDFNTNNYMTSVNHCVFNPSASNNSTQEFPIQTYTGNRPEIQKPKIVTMKQNLHPIDTRQRGQHHLQIDGIPVRKHIKCTPIYDTMPQNMHISNIDNMFWSHFYVPPIPGPPRPPYQPHYPPPPYPQPRDQSAESPSIRKSKTVLDPSHSKSIAGTTVIGQNGSGPIRKINILAAPVTVSKESNYSISEPEKPVHTKEGMIEVLSKATSFIASPQKPVRDLKRSLLRTDLHSPVSNSSNDVKISKPGPLSKKPKLDLHSSTLSTPLVPRKGYSPPILPIPTYQKSLEILAKANMADARMSAEYDDKIIGDAQLQKSDQNVKKNLTFKDYNLDKSLKKISLDEYKKRGSKSDEKREEAEIVKADIVKKRISTSENADQDLGYDSDSTVRC